MSSGYNLCIIKPNKSAFSETFIQQQIDRLAGNKRVLYGGSFPMFDDQDHYLIKSKLGLLSYLIQKRVFKKQQIGVRTKALVNWLKANNIDIVLAQYGMVGAMVSQACQMANVPLVIHFHGADAHHIPTVQTYQQLYKKAFGYASAIVAVSGDMVNALKQLGAPADKIKLNPYGVDTHKFVKLDISKSGVNFIAIGRFVAKKSPVSVIKAFKLVVDKFPEAHLWMVGTGALFDETVAFAKSEGLSNNVTFTGVLSPAEIQKLMQNMRCFVQHSVTPADGDMEGTPNAVLEASASGLPVVSTLHAGIKEAVIHNQTGYLVPEHDIEGMARYMISLATDVSLASQLGANGYDHIKKNYDIVNRIAMLDGIIQQALKK